MKLDFHPFISKPDLQGLLIFTQEQQLCLYRDCCLLLLSDQVSETPNTQELALALLSHISAASCASSAPLDTRVNGHISRSSNKMLLSELSHQKLKDFKHSRKLKPFLGAFLIQTCFDKLGIFGCSIIQGYIFQANIWFSFEKEC